MDTLGNYLCRWARNDHTECTVKYVALYLLAGLDRHQRRLLWLWTKAAMMLDWERSNLDITTAGFVGISYCCTVLGIELCWCWQCLLTVCGNLLLYTVTTLNVTIVAWCCRQTQNILHPEGSPPGTLQTSEWELTASVFTDWYSNGRYNHLFTAHKCLQHNLTLWFGCWTHVTYNFVNWYYPLRYAG